MRIRSLAGWVTVMATVLAATTSASSAATARVGAHDSRDRTVSVQLLSFNDFHGNLEPPPGASGHVTSSQQGGNQPISSGGVEYLANALRTVRKGHPYSVTAAAGDVVGASPLLSGFFHDEPTIEAMNELGLNVTSVGNHEFDEGLAELLRKQHGGCHPKIGCYGKGKKFKGAKFRYLAANVTDAKTGKQILEPYMIWQHKDVKIGFIGVTLKGTPNVTQGAKGLKFGDEVETINRYAEELNHKGVKAIVALLHQGGFPASNNYDYKCDTPSAGSGLSGPIVDIAKRVTHKVAALVTGHTHEAYVCTIPDPSGTPRVVTSAASFGRLYTETTLTYDLQTNDIVRTAGKLPHAVNRAVSHSQPKATDMTQLIKHWNGLVASEGNKPVGYISADINGRGSKEYEKPLGDVIADAQLEGMSVLDKSGAQIAFMNPGGIRSDLAYKATGSEGDGVVSYRKAYAVQPFPSMIETKDLTGSQIISVLQQQVSGNVNGPKPKILQISKGLTYRLDLTKSGMARIVISSVKLNNVAIAPDKTYRVAANDFLMNGGDGFPAFKEGTNVQIGLSSLDAFINYLKKHSSKKSPLAPPKAERVTLVKQ